MINTIEFNDDLGHKKDSILIVVIKGYNSKFLEWQKGFKGKKPDIKSVQRTEYGIFVVYEL